MKVINPNNSWTFFTTDIAIYNLLKENEIYPIKEWDNTYYYIKTKKVIKIVNDYKVRSKVKK